MRLWYLSNRRPAKVQASLWFRAVSPEPSLFTHIKNGSRRSQTSSPIGWLRMCIGRTEFTEDEKYNNLMRWLKEWMLVLKFRGLSFCREVVERLLRAEAQPGITDHQGCTPCHLAAWHGDAEICLQLLNAGTENVGEAVSEIVPVQVNQQVCFKRIIQWSKNMFTKMGHLKKNL